MPLEGIMCVVYWLGEHLDRILAFIAVIIAVIAMVDVRRLLSETLAHQIERSINCFLLDKYTASERA
jgi:hypothetical protein